MTGKQENIYCMFVFVNRRMTSIVTLILLSLCFFGHINPEGIVITSLISWTVCSSQDPFIRLTDLALRKCGMECLLRKQCKAFNYWRFVHVCEMMASYNSAVLTNSLAKCIYARRQVFVEDAQISHICRNCTLDEVCDVLTGACSIRECQKLTVDNGIILGNMQQQGARAKLICNSGYTLGGMNSMSVCLQNGSWSDLPTCTTVSEPDCGEPPVLANVALVTNGSTTIGATRTYTCVELYVIKKNGVKTNMTSENAVCDVSGNWTLNFECVENCPDGWKLLGRSCYGFTLPVSSYTQGKLACEAIHTEAHLVDMNTQAEQQRLRDWTWNHFQTAFTFTGGQNVGTEPWMWSDGTPVETWGWLIDEPDNAYGTNCLIITMSVGDFMWYDYTCTAAFDALCELNL